jgi:hypothetical protein
VANFDRVIRYVVVDPERVRAQRGSRWAAFAEYDMDRTAQCSVRAADGQLLRRINMPRIPPNQLQKISVPVALIWSRNDRITRFRIAEQESAASRTDSGGPGCRRVGIGLAAQDEAERRLYPDPGCLAALGIE